MLTLAMTCHSIARNKELLPVLLPGGTRWSSIWRRRRGPGLRWDTIRRWIWRRRRRILHCLRPRCRTGALGKRLVRQTRVPYRIKRTPYKDVPPAPSKFTPVVA